MKKRVNRPQGAAIPVRTLGGSLGSFFGSLASSAGGVVSSVLNANYASEEAAKQRDWQYQMWQAQNNYNHPANMAARMRAAGLNPYTMTGAEPAGSVGSGAAAGGAPYQMSMDPLGAFRTIAEISNLEADSELKGSEYDLNLAKTAQTVLLYQLGLIDKTEAERDLSLFLDATNSENPYKIDYANKKADTLAKEASARASDASARHQDALAQTENTLRNLRVSNLSASNEEIRQRTDNFRQEYINLQETFKSLSRENQLQSAYRVIGHFYGLETIANLPPALIAKASEYYQDFVRGDYTYESTISAFQAIVNLYNEKDVHIPYSVSESEDIAISPWKSRVSWSQSYSH